MTLLTCNDGLIGDFLGMLPVVIELAKRENELHVNIHPEAEPLFQLVPKKYNIKLQQKENSFYSKTLELNVSIAFNLSGEYNYYMSQLHFAYLGLPVPENPPKAELEFELTNEPEYDYVLAPFSRSLPPQQRWPKKNWQRLVDRMQDKSFCIIGHDRDERNFVEGANVTQMYSEPLLKVISTLKRSKNGLISVVSGPSHLCFHLGVKNYLLTNQDRAWGNNPDAVKIYDYIPELNAERLIEILKHN